MTEQYKPDWKLAFALITPEMAQDMLAVVVRNRPIRLTMVNTYASDMRNDRWLFTPEPIIVDKNGGVLDGQHRLQAVVDTGIARQFLVISNVDPDLIDVLGIGRGRTAADVLRIEGEKNADKLAAAAKVLHNYLTIPPTYVWGGYNSTLSPPGVTEVLRQHPQLRDCVETGARLATHVLASPSAIIAALYITSRDMPLQDQGQWLTPLESGASLEPGSPALALRAFYRSLKLGRQKYLGQDKARVTLASYLHAWLLWKHGKQSHRLQPPKAIPQVGLPQSTSRLVMGR